MLRPYSATNADLAPVSRLPAFPLCRRTLSAPYAPNLYFPLLDCIPYLSANRISRRSTASANRRLSSGVFRISGGTGLGIRVCSSTATNVTYAVVVCFLSPLIAFSE